MRWSTFAGVSEAEARLRSNIEACIDAWWGEFARESRRVEEYLRGELNWDCPGWISHCLDSIDQQLDWEADLATTGDHQLVITPEDRLYLRPLVEVILDRAPIVPGWTFSGYRGPFAPDVALSRVESITETVSGFLGASCRRGVHNTIDVIVSTDDLDGGEDGLAMTQATLLTELIVGEEVAADWLGGVTLVASGSHRESFDLLREEFLFELESINRSLPSRPYLESAGRRCSVFKCRPPKMKDYPGNTDLLTAMSELPEMWLATQAGRPFASIRFSAFGERFCYLKIDSSFQVGFDDRAAISAYFHERLVSAGAGCVVGGGTGIRYSYVDLAVVDMSLATEVVCASAREAKLPSRSWILFYDSTLQHEWIGLGEDTPPPPE